MVSKLMDEAPEWRDWLAGQLELLDLRYDATQSLLLPSERIRG